MATPGGVSITGGVALAQAPIQILGASAVAVSAPADITEDVLATITVPANAMGANGVLRISLRFTFTNNANTKTLRARWSGITGTSLIGSLSQTTQTEVTWNGSIVVANRNATGSQLTHAEALTGAGSVTVTGNQPLSVDTTASTTIVITGQKAVAGDTLTLESYLVELIPGN
jgi:hypothetical protein